MFIDESELNNLEESIIVQPKNRMVELIKSFESPNEIIKEDKKKPVDEKKIEQSKQAIAEKDRQAMVEILAQSELAEKKINANLANAETEKLNTLEATRIRTSSMSNDELAQELERRLK